jgi:undecaprenyl-diphosphatase
MHVTQILILAVVQGAAELLPISSSAHVIVAEKLMGLDPTTPAMTLLLVMLHTGTMFAVIVYFWKSWRATYFASFAVFRTQATFVVVATLMTAIVGVIVLKSISHLLAAPGFEVEHLFGNAKLMAAALAAAGVLIIVASRFDVGRDGRDVALGSAVWIGAVQGLCLPFRGFSRSGATISTGLLLGLDRRRAEEFSFALAVVLTPPVVVREALRLCRVQDPSSLVPGDLLQVAIPSLLGMVFSFVTGLLALRWLSSWLERGRWFLFGCYCLVASVFVLWIG